MIEIESDFEYINGIMMGKILDFQMNFENGNFTRPELERIAEELESTARSIAVEQGLSGTSSTSYGISMLRADGPTGNLINNISAKVIGDRVEFANRAQDLYGRYYAGHVEFGHKDRGGGFIPARPFMRPAMYTVSEASKGRINGSMTRYLNSLWSLEALDFGHSYTQTEGYTRAFYRGGSGYTAGGLKRSALYSKQSSVGARLLHSARKSSDSSFNSRLRSGMGWQKGGNSIAKGGDRIQSDRQEFKGKWLSRR